MSDEQRLARPSPFVHVHVAPARCFSSACLPAHCLLCRTAQLVRGGREGYGVGFRLCSIAAFVESLNYCRVATPPRLSFSLPTKVKLRV